MNLTNVTLKMKPFTTRDLRYWPSVRKRDSYVVQNGFIATFVSLLGTR
jgi:hypothetical protein